MAKPKGSITQSKVSMSLQECADILGVSPQRISELEKKGLKKIRNILLTKYAGKLTLEDLLPVTKEELDYVD